MTQDTNTDTFTFPGDNAGGSEGEQNFFSEFEEPVQPATPPEDLLNQAEEEAEKEKDQEPDFFAGSESDSESETNGKAGTEQKYSVEQVRKMNQRMSKIIANIWNEVQAFVFGNIVALTGNTQKYMYGNDTIEQLSMLIQDMLPEDRIKFGGNAMVAVLIGQQTLMNSYTAMEERRQHKQEKSTMQLHKPESETRKETQKQTSTQKEPEPDFFADDNEDNEENEE